MTLAAIDLFVNLYASAIYVPCFNAPSRISCIFLFP